jgi:hypothetical protein
LANLRRILEKYFRQLGAYLKRWVKTQNSAQILAIKRQAPAFADVHPIWLHIVNNVRAILERQNGYIYIPDLRSFTNA